MTIWKLWVNGNHRPAHVMTAHNKMVNVIVYA